MERRQLVSAKSKKSARAGVAYSRQPIVDEFTNLPISRQRKWQLRRERDGNCRICGSKKATHGLFCKEHHLFHVVMNREAARTRNGATKRYNSKYQRVQA